MENKIARASITGLLITTLLLPFQVARAAPILEDNFVDRSKVDNANTSSVVDTSKQEVRLPFNGNALATVGGNTPQYVVPTANGISWYGFDEASNSMKQIASYSVPGVTPLGLAVRQDSPSVWAVVDDGTGAQSLVRYDYNDAIGGMSNNPYLSVTGLSNVLSITAQPAADEVTVLSRSAGGTGVITTYMQDASTGQLVPVPTRTFDTGLVDPLSISYIPNSPDIVAKTRTGVYFYVFDDATGSYTQNPAVTITDSDALQMESNSVSADQGTVLINQGSNPGSIFKLDDATGKYAKLPATFNGASGSAVSVSLLQGTNGNQMATLFPDGSIHFFTVDDAGPGINYQDVPWFNVTGIPSPRMYFPRGEYRSVMVPTGTLIEQVKLTTTEANDPNTQNRYEVSTDGGTTWTPITVGSWIAVPTGNQVVLKAIQTSPDGLGTPKIRYVKLEGTWLSVTDLTASQIFYPGPTQSRPTPTTSFPVYVRAGGQVEFTVNTTGGATSVLAQFTDGTSMQMAPVNDVSSESNTWIGWYHVDLNAPDGKTVGVTITGQNSLNSKSLTQDPILSVDNSVRNLSGVILTQ